MVRFKFLLVIGVSVAATFACLPASPSSAVPLACSAEKQKLGVCPETGGIANGPGVDLSADITTRSNGTGSSSHPRRGRTGSGTPAAPRECAHGDPAKPGITTIPCGNGQFLPLARPGVATAPCTACSPDTIVRVTDLQNFPAYPASTTMEPNGWAIVGLPANFWAGASAQISTGLLLGQPAQVMFTPISYHWNYGDGTTATTTTTGASWDTLGLTEFSPTDTSHPYTTTGTHTVTLTINYQADYSFGDQDWRPVDGTVTVPSTPFTVVTARESTVLVAHDCLTNPHGPGC